MERFGAREGLRPYYRALAMNNIADPAKTPAELGTPCFYVNNIFARTRALEPGFPRVMWRADGRCQLLLEAQRRALEETLFGLPDYPR